MGKTIFHDMVAEAAVEQSRDMIYNFEWNTGGEARDCPVRYLPMDSIAKLVSVLGNVQLSSARTFSAKVSDTLELGSMRIQFQWQSKTGGVTFYIGHETGVWHFLLECAMGVGPEAVTFGMLKGTPMHARVVGLDAFMRDLTYLSVAIAGMDDA